MRKFSAPRALSPKERVSAIFAALPEALDRERVCLRETILEVSVIGAGAYTVQMSPAGCVIFARHAVNPIAIFALNISAFLWIYEESPTERFLEARRIGILHASDFEQLVFFARAFNHAAVGKIFATKSHLAEPTVPTPFLTGSCTHSTE